ncbi:alpha-N-arabinofuranosidase [Vibrio xiamenensis]|uniref:non-reducing end alpha-L-arabinofuranosidase n=1 Tax=Vibrio xiamenensis TaxID=861298 RepID=A0A1G8FYF1_9VIBR|nr:alpha-N-arabinofuranosidase [Vibrio xiamenensis]SDH87090.1 alpha-N-arabinofuranosidase [Vibrio xiamenensis]
MKKAKCIVNQHFKLADIDERIYGSFIEHMGRAVYTGIYQPEHHSADEQGFRQDVLEAIQSLNVPIVRYPGGNFVSGYDWQDGIGPKSERPTRLDYAWLSIENNQFGINEFADWAAKAHTQGMIAVNLGSGTPQQAGYLAEYCNIDKGTYWSDKRREHGYEQPHNFKVWCLGNEMDGPWQTCALSAQEYANKARETAKILKWVDPSIELVACGSSSKEMATFPSWDRTVLEACYEHVDYISLHRYYEYEGDKLSFLAAFHDLNDFIHTIKATADYVKAEKRSDKVMMLSLDEWNVWYIKHMDTKRWQWAPAIAEDVYSLMDALVMGGLLTTIVNNADRVKMACLAQLVNALAPIHTSAEGGVLKHATYYPFMQVSNYGRGSVYKNIVLCDEVQTEKYGAAPQLATLTTFDADSGEMAFFVLNTDLDHDVELELRLEEFGALKMIERQVLTGDDLFAVNSFDAPNNVVPTTQECIEHAGSQFSITLPKTSWTMLRFRVV